jgi:hypothetical protein
VTTKAAAAGASNGLRSIRVARPARSLPQADGMWAWVVGVGGRGPGGSGLGWDPLLGRRARQITSKSKRLDQTGCPGGLLQKRRGPAAAPRFRQFEQPVPSAAAASGQAGLHRHRLGPPPCRDRERHQKYSSTMIPCSRRPGSLCTTHLAPLPSPTRLRIHIVTHVQSTKYILHMERLRWIWQSPALWPASCGTAEECTPGPTLGRAGWPLDLEFHLCFMLHSTTSTRIHRVSFAGMPKPPS